ncbi:TPA: hypothetical protein ACOEA5_002366 [Enterobacter kobei]
MSTITKEFTKEQLVEHLRTRIEHRKGLIASMHIDRGYRDYLKLELRSSEIALASLEADAVAYVDPFAFHNFSVYRAGETDNKRMGREWMWANPDAGLIPVYTAPPAPVSVPTFDEWLEIRGNKPLGWVKDAMRESYDACRAAMLQGVENAESPTTMHPAPALDSSPKIAESPSGNSPVIPDDVRRMDWLVSKTVDVREPMVYGSHSLFWSQTITDEEDEYHATKLREQIDAAMEAEQAAAPQQEAKNV